MLYRIAVYLVEPYTIALVLLWLATLRLVWRGEAVRGKGAVFLAVLLLTVISLPATGHLAVASLEGPYPFTRQRPEDVDAIVVLGGSTRLLDELGGEAILAGDSMNRCLHAAALYREGPPIPIIACGGKVKPELPGPTVAKAMSRFLRVQGVPAEDLVLEEGSTTTYENAVHCRAILEEHGWTRVALVTDALHMERARRCFETLGVQAQPSPCNQISAFFPWTMGSFAPSVGGLLTLRVAVHEWLGLAWYRLQGRI